jgi:hypothetical protein
MRYLAALILACTIVLPARAQVDTLMYDGITNIMDGKLIAVTRFPGELDVIFNARFSPAEKCTLHTVLVGFSVVKFQALTGNDTLVVFVFEHGNVPPMLVGLQKTYTVNLGDAGFPSPNIRFQDPLEAGGRDVLAVKLNPPIIFSPKRDFIVGVKILSRQKIAVGQGLWNGFSMLSNPEQPEYQRYRRYLIAPEERNSRNDLATQGANVSLFIRSVVTYNPNLPNVDVTSVEETPLPTLPTLAANFPNPFISGTTLHYSLPERAAITLTVHDMLGRVVSVLADGMMDAGSHSVQFDARGLPPGMYMARLLSGGVTATRSMLLLQ